MTPRPLRLRPRARRDIAGAATRYRADAGEGVALAFADALERAFRHIALHPATGSPRYGHTLGLPGLRLWPLERFPHLVFCFERADHIDILRVLHARRDIPALLRGAFSVG